MKESIKNLQWSWWCRHSRSNLHSLALESLPSCSMDLLHSQSDEWFQSLPASLQERWLKFERSEWQRTSWWDVGNLKHLADLAKWLLGCSERRANIGPSTLKIRAKVAWFCMLETFRKTLKSKAKVAWFCLTEMFRKLVKNQVFTC